MAKPNLPSTMQALVLSTYGGPLTVAERPVPRPSRGEVLVKIHASPVNPSDLMFMRGLYVQKDLPIVPGFEASGTVVDAGPGLSRALLGRKVACSAPQEGDGTWAQFMVTSAAMCFPLLPGVELEAAAALIVNPLTALALLDEAKRAGARAVVQTAAASALGRMLVRVCRRRKIPLVNVVRRPAQVTLLRDLGAEHVLDSTDPSFDGQLRELCRSLSATVALDAVAGDLTGRLLEAMPRGSKAIVYGALAEEAVSIHPGQLIFSDKRVEGFWLAGWVKKRGIPAVVRAGLSVQRRLGSDFRTEVRARLRLTEAAGGIDAYAQAMSEGKVLLVPDSILG